MSQNSNKLSSLFLQFPMPPTCQLAPLWVAVFVATACLVTDVKGQPESEIIGERKEKMVIHLCDGFFKIALVDFYYATNGPTWLAKDNWLTGAPCGSWKGVSCTSNFTNQLYYYSFLSFLLVILSQGPFHLIT